MNHWSIYIPIFLRFVPTTTTVATTVIHLLWFVKRHVNVVYFETKTHKSTQLCNFKVLLGYPIFDINRCKMYILLTPCIQIIEQLYVWPMKVCQIEILVRTNSCFVGGNGTVWLTVEDLYGMRKLWQQKGKEDTLYGNREGNLPLEEMLCSLQWRRPFRRDTEGGRLKKWGIRQI